jgi:hypothetical protein
VLCFEVGKRHNGDNTAAASLTGSPVQQSQQTNACRENNQSRSLADTAVF